MEIGPRVAGIRAISVSVCLRFAPLTDSIGVAPSSLACRPSKRAWRVPATPMRRAMARISSIGSWAASSEPACCNSRAICTPITPCEWPSSATGCEAGLYPRCTASIMAASWVSAMPSTLTDASAATPSEAPDGLNPNTSIGFPVTASRSAATGVSRRSAARTWVRRSAARVGSSIASASAIVHGVDCPPNTTACGSSTSLDRNGFVLVIVIPLLVSVRFVCC